MHERNGRWCNLKQTWTKENKLNARVSCWMCEIWEPCKCEFSKEHEDMTVIKGIIIYSYWTSWNKQLTIRRLIDLKPVKLWVAVSDDTMVSTNNFLNRRGLSSLSLFILYYKRKTPIKCKSFVAVTSWNLYYFMISFILWKKRSPEVLYIYNPSLKFHPNFTMIIFMF